MIYTLTTDNPFIDPRFLNKFRGTKHIGTVIDPRIVDVDGDKLKLLNDQPDMPVGEKVEIWLSKFFHAEPLNDIKQRKEKARKQQEHFDKVEKEEKENAFQNYVVTTKEFLKLYPNGKEVLEKLESLWKDKDDEYQTYKAFWHSNEKDKKLKSNIAYNSMIEITNAIDMIAHWMKSKIEHECRVSYAYSPREHANAHGGEHLELLEPFSKGKIKRGKNDALCKVRKKFWDLYSVSKDEPVSCRKCLKYMTKMI